MLDFDGVLVDSNVIKDNAFKQVFAAYPEHLDEIMAYQRQTAAIRFEKFRYIYTSILKKTYSTGIEQELAKRFSAYCIKEIIACPWIEGALKFLRYWHGKVPMYLVSINPAEDLDQILRGRGIKELFKRVYTVTSDKSKALREILKMEDTQAADAVFIGDSLSDYDSAQRAGVPFVACRGNDSFAEEKCPVFSDMNEINNFLLQTRV